MWFLSGLICIALGLTSYVLEVFFKLGPGCVLCHIERLLFIIGGVGFLLGVVIYNKYPWLYNAWGRLLTLFWSGSLLVALYHIGIQMHWVPEPSFCRTIDLSMGLDAVNVQAITPPCRTQTWLILGIASPVWTSLAMGVALVMAFIRYRRIKNG